LIQSDASREIAMPREIATAAVCSQALEDLETWEEPSTDPPARDERPEYRLLAAAVIRQALVDGRRMGRAARMRARRFVRSPDFVFWCDVAGLAPDVVRARYAAAVRRTA
jgi:hypothetical protein